MATKTVLTPHKTKTHVPDAFTTAHIYHAIDNYILDITSQAYWSMVYSKKIKSKTLMAKRYNIAQRKLMLKWRNATSRDRRSPDPMQEFPDVSAKLRQSKTFLHEELQTHMALHLTDIYYSFGIKHNIAPKEAELTLLFVLKLFDGFLRLDRHLAGQQRYDAQCNLFDKLTLTPRFRRLRDCETHQEFRRGMTRLSLDGTQEMLRCHINVIYYCDKHQMLQNSPHAGRLMSLAQAFPSTDAVASPGASM